MLNLVAIRKGIIAVLGTRDTHVELPSVTYIYGSFGGLGPGWNYAVQFYANCFTTPPRQIWTASNTLRFLWKLCNPSPWQSLKVRLRVSKLTISLEVWLWWWWVWTKCAPSVPSTTPACSSVTNRGKANLVASLTLSMAGYDVKTSLGLLVLSPCAIV